MDQLYGNFVGDFVAADGTEFHVSGSFATYPVDTPRLYFPNIDLILGLVEIQPIALEGQVQAGQQTLFLTEIDGIWQIGLVDNSQFHPLNSPFYNSIKDIILQGYFDKINMP